MKTKKYRKGAYTHQHSTDSTMNKCTVHGRTSQHRESRKWYRYMRYNVENVITGSVMVIDLSIMAEPMEIPEGGGGDGVKDDGGKGEKTNIKNSLYKSGYMRGPMCNMYVSIYIREVKYVCNWHSRYGE
jgi:hypothetical protein